MDKGTELNCLRQVRFDRCIDNVLRPAVAGGAAGSGSVESAVSSGRIADSAKRHEWP
jgi:hypothetical protein